MFVDQRGTGGSNRVLIPTDPPDLTGLTPEEMDTKAKEWVAGCLSEIDMDPQYYTTSVAMDDLDEVREALGYDKINLFGYSYGATGGTVLPAPARRPCADRRSRRWFAARHASV